MFADLILAWGQIVNPNEIKAVPVKAKTNIAASTAGREKPCVLRRSYRGISSTSAARASRHQFLQIPLDNVFYSSFL